eukprot:Lithocolla_globosa_v1_NODE_16_length_10446_cov_10.815802.p10 type:complete len:122 gc:universal NODE_16_length_10446_cov_10.815802:1713-2078(+)
MSEILVDCYTCKKMLPVEAFSKDTRNKNRHGTRSDCKACHAIRCREFRKTHDEYRRRQSELYHKKYIANVVKPKVEVNPDLIPRIPPIIPGRIPPALVMNRKQKNILEAAGLDAPLPAIPV